MASIHFPLVSNDHLDLSETPMSRTHQYRKVMKPLLERKRRARINKCLDELKDLMVDALQSEGDSITKLEKADVLELTVQHLEKLKRQRMLQINPSLDADRFNSGFTACANEVSRCLSTIPGMDVQVGTQIMTHLGVKLKSLESPASLSSPLTVATAEGRLSPAASTPRSDGGYSSGRDSVSPSSPVDFSNKRARQEDDEDDEEEDIDVGGPEVKRARPASPVWRPF